MPRTQMVESKNLLPQVSSVCHGTCAYTHTQLVTSCMPFKSVFPEPSSHSVSRMSWCVSSFPLPRLDLPLLGKNTAKWPWTAEPMNESKSPSYFRDGGGRGDAQTHDTDDTTLKYTHTLYIHIYIIWIKGKNHSFHGNVEEPCLPSCRGENSELLFCLGGVNITAGSKICAGKLLARFKFSVGVGPWDSLTGNSSCGNSMAPSPLNIDGMETLLLTTGPSEKDKMTLIWKKQKGINYRHLLGI